MNEWYAMVNDLETMAAPVDELTQKRIQRAARKSLPKRRTYMKIAVVAAVLLVLTACGVAVSKYSQWFWNMVQNPFAPEQSEDILASMGTDIDQSQTVDGVTITLHGALYDGEYLVLALSMEGDTIPETDHRTIRCENSSLFYSRAQYEKNLHSSNDQALLDPADWEAYCREYLSWYDQIAETGSLNLLSRTNYREEERFFLVEEELIWKGDDASEPVELTLHLQELMFPEHTVAGPFDFTFSVAPNQSRQVYEGNLELEPVPGVSVAVNKVVVTPLRITVYFDGIGRLPGEEQRNFGITEVTAGDAWVYASRSGGQISWDEQTGSWNGYRQIGPLERVVDPTIVTAVQLGSTVIDLTQMTQTE